MPYIIIALALVFAVTLVVAVMASVEVYLETQRSSHINFVGNSSDTIKWIEGISLDGFPVEADYEGTDPSTEFYSEEDEYLMVEEFFSAKPGCSMSRSQWNRAWDNDGYEVNLSCKLRKAHPARASKARK